MNLLLEMFGIDEARPRRENSSRFSEFQQARPDRARKLKQALNHDGQMLNISDPEKYEIRNDVQPLHGEEGHDLVAVPPDGGTDENPHLYWDDEHDDWIIDWAGVYREDTEEPADVDKWDDGDDEGLFETQRPLHQDLNRILQG